MPPASSGSDAATHAYNWIYKELVTSPDDAVGAIAYMLYKRDKIAFIEATHVTHRRAPTPDELKVFHNQTCNQLKIEAYRAHAEQLAEAFLNAGLKERIEQIEEEVRESVLNQSVQAITSELKARKGIWAWVGDVVGNLGVNIATILVIGALLGGYQAIAKFNANVEKIANVPGGDTAASPVPAGKPTAVPDSPPAR